MKVKIVLSLLFVLSNGLCLRGQFSDHSEYLNELWFESTLNSLGNGASFFDFDNDGLDDLTYCSAGAGLYIFKSTGNDFMPQFFFPFIEGTLSTPTWIDLENDGDNDFFVSRFGDTPKLFLNNGDFTFMDISDHLPCPNDHPYSTAACWGDYDRDGLLDLYMANYNSYDDVTSWLFHNLGNTYFDEVATDLNVNNGSNQALQCIWLDYDFDFDQDLFVVNDFHKGTRLYQNDGSGQFVDVALETNFYLEANCMGLSNADFDQDGDWDFFITNTVGNIFLLNENNYFVNRASDYDVDQHCTSWGCLWIDSQNESFEDLFVLANSNCYDSTNFYYENITGTSFIDSNDPMPETQLPAYVNCKGDYNADGFYDLALSTGWIIRTIQFWQNDYQNGHYLRLDLNGNMSNIHGVGAIIKCHIGERTLMRSLMSGDNYLSQDSQYINIGLGNDTIVDQVEVIWPSGSTDRYYNVYADQLLTIEEGITMVPDDAYIELSMCEGTSIELMADASYDYLWNSGDTTQLITVSEPGVYEVEVITPFGLSYTITYTLSVLQNPQPQFTIVHPDCPGISNGSIAVDLNGLDLSSLIWIEDEAMNSNVITNLNAGTYHAQLDWINGCTSIYTFDLIAQSIPALTITADTACHGGTSSATIAWQNNDDGEYFILWDGIDPNALFPGLYEITYMNEAGCAAMKEFAIHEFDEAILQPIYQTPCWSQPTYISWQHMSGPDIVELLTPGWNPDEVFSGEYIFLTIDEHGCEIQNEVEIDQLPPLELSCEILPLSDDSPGLIILEVYGGTPPYSFYWQDQSTESNLEVNSQGTYSCVITDSMGCAEEISSVVINTEVQEDNTIGLKVYPNPFTDVLMISTPQKGSYKLFSIDGQCLLQGDICGNTANLQVGLLPDGPYIFELDNIVFQLIKNSRRD